MLKKSVGSSLVDTSPRPPAPPRQCWEFFSILLILFLARFALPSCALALSRGSTGADFLKLSAGVRAVAMGSSYAAVGEDVYSLYWNPAGIARLEAPEFAGSYVKLFDRVDGVGLYTGVVEIPHFPFESGNMGAGFMILTAGTFDSTDPQSFVRAAVGGASDMLVFFSYGQPFSESLSFGTSLKLIQRTLAGADPNSFQFDPVSGSLVPTRSINFQASGVGMDLGCLWENQDRTFGIGAAVQNIGQMGGFQEGFGFALGQNSEALPMLFRLGGAVRTRLWGHQLLGTLDLTSLLESMGKPRLSLGTEYGLGGIFFIRAGWEQPLDAPVGRTALDSGGRTGLGTLPSTLRSGLGFRWKLTQASMVQFDYALAPFGTLGAVHHAAMLLRWNIPEITRARGLKPPPRKAPIGKRRVAMVIEPKQIKFQRPVKEWRVEIKDEKGRVVKTFAGTGVPPKTLPWDGTDERGKVLTNLSRYKFVLKAKDIEDKEMQSSTRIATVSAEPQLKAVAGKPLYPEVVFVLPQGNFQLWQLKIQDAGRLVRSWEGKGQPKRRITWDGKDQAGRVKVLKRPRYAWKFVEQDGRKITGERPLPQVEASIKPEAGANQVRLIGIRFAGTDTDLTEAHHVVLRKAAMFLREHPGSALAIESYADAPGGDQANYALSKLRAEKVWQALLDEHDLTASRVMMQAFGRSKSAPAYPNMPAGELNQRVDLVISVRP